MPQNFCDSHTGYGKQNIGVVTLGVRWNDRKNILVVKQNTQMNVLVMLHNASFSQQSVWGGIPRATNQVIARIKRLHVIALDLVNHCIYIVFKKSRPFFQEIFF
jgi:hypothetical protein